jgi:gluconate 2-dehydrogenase
LTCLPTHSAAALRHSVLVTQALSSAAMQRLQVFFEVETRIETVVPARDELAQWLHGKAGVIADTRFIFDAQLVSGLPVLKAICNLDEAHHNLDLPALTSAGIRATSTPGADSAKLALEAATESAWHLLVLMLRDALPLTGNEGRYNSRWSRKDLLSESVGSMCVGIVGEGALADALAARRQRACV